MTSSEPFNLGSIRVQPQSNRLIGRDNTRTRLEPRLMSLLVQLFDAEGEVLPRTRLIDQVWGAGLGSDELLTQSISKLRRELQTLGCTTVIETVHKVGYRLILTPDDQSEVSSSFKSLSPRLEVWLRWLPLLLVVLALVLFTIIVTQFTEIEIEITPEQNSVESTQVIRSL